MIYDIPATCWTRDFDTAFAYLLNYLELVVTRCTYLKCVGGR